MLRTQLSVLLTLVTFATVQVHAQEPQQTSFSLHQAIDYAVKNSPSHQNSDLDRQIAEHRVKEITGMGLPQVNANLDIKNYIAIPTSLIPAQAFNPMAGPDDFLAVKFGTKYNGTAGINASQLIFSSDYIFGLKASREFLNLARISIDRSRQELIAAVSKAYYFVVISKDRIKLLDLNIGRLKKNYDEVKAMNQQGLTELIDVERLEVAYNNLLTEKDKAEQFIGVSEYMLKFQMGYEIERPITLTDSIDPAIAEYTETRFSPENLTQRPDIQLLQSQQTLLDIDHRRNRWAYLPSLAAYGAYQFNTMRQKPDFLTFDDNNPVQQWYKIVLIGATLNVNIFTGLQQHNKIQQARINALKNQNALKAAMLAGELQARSASISYRNSYTSLQVQKKNLELSKHVFEVADKKFKSGLGSNLEVITSESAFKEAQINYYNALYEMMVAKIDYQKAIGQLK